MRMYIFLALLISSVLTGRILVDEVVAVIQHGEGAMIITRSDVRPGLDGMPRTLRDVVLEYLMVLDAQKLKITISDEDVDRFLMQLQKQNGLTKTAIERLFEQLGYTYQEGREQLRVKQMIETIVDFRVKSDKRLMIEEQDVSAAYQAHPVYEPIHFTLRQVYLEKSEYSPEAIQKIIEAKNFDALPWEEPFDLDEQDLADDKQFLKTAEIGSLVDQDTDDQGVELTQLVARTTPRLRSFQERRAEIEMELRKERYFMILREYEEKLLKQGHITFMHEEDQKTVRGERNPID